uniref:Uncharacterized protein n=1 Tax=Podarcis muralis TaxID=64176 RepID=A0A670K0P1_PODMU
MRLRSGVFASACLLVQALGVGLFLRGFFPVPVRSLPRSGALAGPPAEPPPTGKRFASYLAAWGAGKVWGASLPGLVGGCTLENNGGRPLSHRPSREFVPPHPFSWERGVGGVAAPPLNQDNNRK